jgi:hypothetical protein
MTFCSLNVWPIFYLQDGNAPNFKIIHILETCKMYFHLIF